MKKPYDQLLATLGFAGGIISAVNIVGNIDTIFEVSSSLHYIVDWWDYVVYLVFSPLPFEIPKVTKDLLLIISIATASVNYFTIRKYGKNIFRYVEDGIESFLDDIKAHQGDPILGGLTSDGRGSRKIGVVSANVGCAGVVAISLVLTIYFLYSYGLKAIEIVAISSSSYVAIIVVSVYISEFLGRLGMKSAAGAILWIVTLPVRVPVYMYYVISSYVMLWKYVLATAGAVASILLVDVIFVRVVDPLEPYLKRLPKAPPIPENSKPWSPT